MMRAVWRFFDTDRDGYDRLDQREINRALLLLQEENDVASEMAQGTEEPPSREEHEDEWE